MSISFRELENVHFVQNHSSFTIILSYKKKAFLRKKEDNIIIKHFRNCIVIKRLKKKGTYNKIFFFNILIFFKEISNRDIPFVND